MSERGVFAVDRGIWDHDVFADEAFTEREAWVWMISEAAWRPRTRNVGGKIVALARGQLAASLRFMADRWGWEKDAVARFLTRLKKHDMIATETATGLSVITICKYDEYQRVSLPSATDTKTETATATRQQCDKTEDIESIEDRKKKEPRALALIVDDGWPADFREQFWSRYPNKVGKPKALAKLDGVRRRGVAFAEIMTGLDRYIASKPPDRAWLNPETFINQERWADQPAPVTQQQGGNGKRTIQDAARDLLERVRSFDEPEPTGELRGPAGGAPLRLLSQG